MPGSVRFATIFDAYLTYFDNIFILEELVDAHPTFRGRKPLPLAKQQQ